MPAAHRRRSPLRTLTLLAAAIGACHGDTSDTPTATTSGATSTSDVVSTAVDTITTTTSGQTPTDTGSAPDMGTVPAFDDEWSLDLGGAMGQPVPTAAGGVPDNSGGELLLNATAGAGLRFVDGHPFGVVGVAFAGDGSGVIVEDPGVALLADLEPAEPLTIELGFRSDAHGQDGADGAGVLLERAGGFTLAIVDGRVTFTLVAADGGPTATLQLDEPAVVDGRWHRVIATRDSAQQQLTLTLDGAFRVSGPDATAGLRVAGEASLAVGTRVDGSRALLGAVDHVRVTRRATAPFVAEAGGDTTIFKAGSEPVPGGGKYTIVRIPAIVQSSDGSLIAFAEGRVDAICDFGDIDAVAKRSTDRGHTWSPLQRIADNGKGKVGNVIPFFDPVRDRLVLLTSHTDLEGGACSDPVAGSARVKVQHSVDHGVSWSEPVDITDQTTDAAWHLGGLIGPSHGIVLREGGNAGVLAVHAMHRRLEDNLRGGHLLVSRDGGDSWTITTSENTSAPAVQVNESTVAELGDGRLYVNVRHQVGDPGPDERAEGLRGQAFLDADLHYVDEPPFARTAAFRGPVVHGTTLRWVGGDRYGDEPRVLFSYPAGESGTNFSQRHDLRVYLSRDDAGSFAPGVRVFGGLASYSDLVALDDGRVGVVFENARDGEDYNARIDFRALVVQQLDDPTVLAWTFEDGAVGSQLSSTVSAGPNPVSLLAEGSVSRVAGRLHSAAARFDHTRLCAANAKLGHLVDLDVRDGLELEVVFRTGAHQTGGGAAAGTLVAKTAVGTDSAWWLRVEDGVLRFAVGDELGGLDIVEATTQVADGAYHTVRARRDPAAGQLRLSVDGGAPVTAAITTTGVAINGEGLCIGAFAGDGVPRAFLGDIDTVAIRVSE